MNGTIVNESIRIANTHLFNALLFIRATGCIRLPQENAYNIKLPTGSKENQRVFQLLVVDLLKLIFLGA